MIVLLVTLAFHRQKRAKMTLPRNNILNKDTLGTKTSNNNSITSVSLNTVFTKGIGVSKHLPAHSSSDQEVDIPIDRSDKMNTLASTTKQYYNTATAVTNDKGRSSLLHKSQNTSTSAPVKQQYYNLDTSTIKSDETRVVVAKSAASEKKVAIGSHQLKESQTTDKSRSKKQYYNIQPAAVTSNKIKLRTQHVTPREQHIRPPGRPSGQQVRPPGQQVRPPGQQNAITTAIEIDTPLYAIPVLEESRTSGLETTSGEISMHTINKSYANDVVTAVNPAYASKNEKKSFTCPTNSRTTASMETRNPYCNTFNHAFACTDEQESSMCPEATASRKTRSPYRNMEDKHSTTGAKGSPYSNLDIAVNVSRDERKSSTCPANAQSFVISMETRRHYCNAAGKLTTTDDGCSTAELTHDSIRARDRKGTGSYANVALMAVNPVYTSSHEK